MPDGITDPATGLFNEAFFRAVLTKRVAAARRKLRPLALVLFEVDDGQPELVATGVLETVRDADIACRLSDGRYSLILEDTAEKGAVWTVERIRRRLVQEVPLPAMRAGVACYPAHAFDRDGLLDQAHRALVSAREWDQHRTEVAVPPDD